MDLAAFVIVTMSAVFVMINAWGREVPGTGTMEALQPLFVGAIGVASAAIVRLWPSTYWSHR